MNRLVVGVMACLLVACGGEPEIAEFFFDVEEAGFTSARKEPVTTDDGLTSTVGKVRIGNLELDSVTVSGGIEQNSLFRTIQFNFYGPVTAGSIFTVVANQEEVKEGDAWVFYNEFTREEDRGSWDGVGGRILVTRLRDQGFDFSFRVEFAPAFDAAQGRFVAVGGATIRSLPGFNGTAL